MAALAGKKGSLCPARRLRVSGCLISLGSGILGESLAGWGGSNTLVPRGLGSLGTLEVGTGRPKTEGFLRPAREATSREVGPQICRPGKSPG